MRKLLFALGTLSLATFTSCTKEEKPVEASPTPATTTGTYAYSGSGNISAISLFTETAPYTDPSDPINTCYVFDYMPDYLSEDSAETSGQSIKISADDKLTFLQDGYAFITLQATRSSDGGYVVTSDLLSVSITTKYKVVGNQLLESNAYAGIESGDPGDPSYSRYVVPVGIQTPVEAIREQIEGEYRKIAIKTFDRIYKKQ